MIEARTQTPTNLETEGKNRISREEVRKELVQKHFESVRIALNILDSYHKTGFQYRFVGSLAFEALLGGKYMPIRKNGRIRDMDILVDKDPLNVTPEIREMMQKLLRNKTINCIVDLITPHGSDYKNPMQFFPARKLSDDGKIKLVFRDIEVELPSSTNTTEQTKIIGPNGSFIEFDTQTAKTMYAFYWRRFKILRPKDKQHIRTIRRLAHKKGVNLDEDNPAKDAMEVFQHEVEKRYPHILYSYLIYRKINDQLNESLGLSLTKLFPKNWK